MSSLLVPYSCWVLGSVIDSLVCACVYQVCVVCLVLIWLGEGLTVFQYLSLKLPLQKGSLEKYYHDSL